MTRTHRGRHSLAYRLIGAVLGAGALISGQLAAAPIAAASTFIVGGCSYSTIIADIEAANDEPTYPGGDTIELHPGCTYILSPDYDGGFAFPAITSDVTIIGHGARIEIADGADANSMFDVELAGSLLLSDVTLAEADGTSSVGAYVRNGGSAVLSNVTITHSIPLNQGGPAISNTPRGTLAVISSTIDHQSCHACQATGIFNEGSATITDSTFDRNTVTEAIDNRGTLAIFGSTFSDNTDHAIVNTGALEVHGSSFLDNQAFQDGAAIQNTGASDLVVDGSYFEGNSTEGEGGAVWNGSEAIAQIVNSTFYDNHVGNHFFPCCVAGTGGAIANHHSLRVEHVTFDRNGASSGASVASPEGLAAIEASVFDDVRAGTNCSGSILDNGSNVVRFSGSGCPSTFTVGDPALSPPAVHGSGTKTLALGANSAAFDAVPAAGCPSYDQRGVARPVGAACDAGAFEDRPPQTPGTPTLSIFNSSPNKGTFTLIWTAGTDPDGTSPGYRLYRRDADDAHYTEVSTPAGTSDARALEPEGTYTYEVASDDGNLLSGKSAASGSIVVDRTPPSAPSRMADRSPESSPWFRDTVTVTFFGSEDPALPDGSPGSGVASTTSPTTFTTSGIHTVTGTATDAAGNVSDPTSATVRVDAEDPTVGFASCPGDVILKSSVEVAWSASDASSGVSGATTGSIPLDTATIGTRAATVTVTDHVGHQATATCPYRVIYDFRGFLAPLASPPNVTDIKAGTVIPVVFGLGGDQGLDVFAAGFPQSAPISCTAPSEPASGAATTASDPLAYQKAQGGRYRYSWQTEKSWSGTCRQLIVTLADGTLHRANVRFK